MSLIEHTLFGVENKVAIAIERLRHYEKAAGESGYIVAFSGGKDSIVVKDLFLRSGCKGEIHYHATTVDPPELIQYIRQYHPDAIVDRPPITMWRLIEKKGLPTRLKRFCCEVLKERKYPGRIVVTGVRWEESLRRRNRQLIELCIKEKTQHFLHPIIDWTEKEIWQYIRVNKLPYCSLYDEGWRRIGCVMCPMNTNRTHEADRWPKIKEAYRRAADRFWARRIAVKGKEYPFQTSDEFWEWWISGKSFKKTGQQEMMLE